VRDPRRGRHDLLSRCACDPSIAAPEPPPAERSPTGPTEGRILAQLTDGAIDAEGYDRELPAAPVVIVNMRDLAPQMPASIA